MICYVVRALWKLYAQKPKTNDTHTKKYSQLQLKTIILFFFKYFFSKCHCVLFQVMFGFQCQILFLNAKIHCHCSSLAFNMLHARTSSVHKSPFRQTFHQNNNAAFTWRSVTVKKLFVFLHLATPVLWVMVHTCIVVDPKHKIDSYTGQIWCVHTTYTLL